VLVFYGRNSIGYNVPVTETIIANHPEIGTLSLFCFPYSKSTKRKILSQIKSSLNEYVDFLNRKNDPKENAKK
jgi:hypothetical protein